MANLNVTYDDLRAAADQLASGEGDINDRLGSLQGYIDTLVSGGYVTSASSGAFHEQYVTFTSSAKLTVSALEGLAQFLRSAAESLQQTDESLASSIRGQ